ncbi:ribosome small subunit-dependent GTPase A [Streptomyces sp. NBC_01334]|uniref:ribosome small subunit-dependent GTPase A n=1 Tax=Streptomyces sp. NBC_01334 TaxID=2903827 RepID=UPI002E1465BA|nr:ribosome small subunit-dependent GTPase A [Streptomyces sp. NBC_01334]
MTGHTDAHPLSRYGWAADVAEGFTPHLADGLVPARVVRVDRGRCSVVVPTAAGGTRTVQAVTGPLTSRDSDPYVPTALFAKPSDGRLRTVCTGDWAAVDPEADPPAVLALLPRRTAFVRSTSSKRSDGQVLAANIDLVVIAVSLAVELDLARMERFLALAWECGAQPLLALTKADLVEDPVSLGYLVADCEAAAPGVRVLAVSAENGAGVEELATAVAGGTAVLLGQSGAGKSTLANALLGEDAQQVQAARDSDGKGRHTTTTRDLMPLPGGGVLIDTPGLRGVGLWDAESGIAQVFSEIEELARSCRFHNCAHDAEPGCAVLSAMADGELSERRLHSYRKLLRENEYIASRTDSRLEAEIRREWKRRQVIGRDRSQRAGETLDDL